MKLKGIEELHLLFFSHPPTLISARADQPGTVVQRPHPPLSGLELAPPSWSRPLWGSSRAPLLGKARPAFTESGGVLFSCQCLHWQRSRRPHGVLYWSALLGRFPVLGPPKDSLAQPFRRPSSSDSAGRGKEVRFLPWSSPRTAPTTARCWVTRKRIPGSQAQGPAADLSHGCQRCTLGLGFVAAGNPRGVQPGRALKGPPRYASPPSLGPALARDKTR